MTPDRDELIKQLTDFVQEQLLAEPDSRGLEPDTPLLEWGILNSVNTARLLTFIREELGVTVPPTQLTGSNFADLDSIADLLLSLDETSSTSA